MDCKLDSYEEKNFLNKILIITKSVSDLDKTIKDIKKLIHKLKVKMNIIEFIEDEYDKYMSFVFEVFLCKSYHSV